MLKKLRKAEKKAFHIKTWNDSEDSEEEELERVVKKVNSHRI